MLDAITRNFHSLKLCICPLCPTYSLLCGIRYSIDKIDTEKVQDQTPKNVISKGPTQGAIG